MEKKQKVYFDKEHYGVWWVDETTDYYYFKAINVKTNEEKEYILSWSRNAEINDNAVRVYDVEIGIGEEAKKYYFNFYYEGDKYRIVERSPMELEKLLQEKGICFVGETKPSE